MSRGAVLARVAKDLEQGDYDRAKSRLHTLLHDAPTDLDLREQLATVYRRAGSPVQAGRWSFLGEQVERERIAFLRAYADPRHRLDALRWAGDADAAPEPAASRLRTLADEISRYVEPERHRRDPEYPDPGSGWFGTAVAALVALTVFALLGIGAATVARWIL